MLPFDQRPLPPTYGAALRKTTEGAAAIRSSAALPLVEGLLAMQSGDESAFTDHIVRSYLGDEFAAYQAKITEAGSLLDLAHESGFKASPFALGFTLEGRVTQGEPFLNNPLTRIISNSLVRAVNGTGKRKICIAGPYRHSKSLSGSVLGSLWFLANFPHLTVGLTGSNDSLLNQFSRTIRNTLQERPEKFGFELAGDSFATQQFATSLGGGLWIASAGAAILGKGCEFLVIDDPFRNWEEAQSKVTRDAVWLWAMSDAMSRVQNEGTVLIVTTRTSEDDLMGRLQKGHDGIDNSAWEFVTVPALWEGADPCPLTGRRTGDALWPARRSREYLEELRAGMPPVAWETGYQQIPPEQSASGKVYGSFDPKVHVRDTFYDDRFALIASCDFNVRHYSIVIGQRKAWTVANPLYAILSGSQQFELQMLEELALGESDSYSAAETLVEALRKYREGRPSLRITITGDATGRAVDTTSKGMKSDWDIIRSVLAKESWLDATYVVPRENPGLVARINTTNGFLRNADGFSRVSISPSCKTLIEDLRTVRWKTDTSGNRLPRQDDRDPKATHMSDAFSYACVNLGQDNSDWRSPNYAGPVPVAFPR